MPDLINVQPKLRWSALHQAAFEGNRCMVEYLLSLGADHRAKSHDGKVPLEVAKLEAEVVLQRLEDEHRFLDQAKAFNWDKVVLLLDASPDLINVQPGGRWSALHQAAHEGNRRMVRFLIERGADVAAASNSGETPRDVATGRAKDDSLFCSQEVSLSAELATTGELLASVTCPLSFTVAAFGFALASKDSGGRSCRYDVATADGRSLGATETLAAAGVKDGATVKVVRKPLQCAEVKSENDLWRHAPGRRYPVTLKDDERHHFYSTKDCQEIDEVGFSTGDFGEGFDRVFVNRPDSEIDTSGESHMHYLPVFITSTGDLKVLQVTADGGRFGGIVIQPGGRTELDDL